jgi:hypothetical protein
MDPIYKQEPTAILVILLIAIIAYNAVHTFHRRSIRPAIRARCTLTHIVQMAKATICAGIPCLLAPT